MHATGVVQNPHDPDAQWSAKGQGKQKKDWVGYKVQVAETVASQEDQSSFITSVVTQRATESDDAGLPATLQKQEGLGLETADRVVRRRGLHLGRAIHEAKEAGWQLVGPAQPSASRAGVRKGISNRSLRYQHYRAQSALSRWKDSTNCSKLTEEKSGKVTYRFEFGSQCHNCPHKVACVPSTQAHRTILVGAYHEVLQQRRRDQQSEEFQLRMHQRNAIEGTISELVRGHGLRRARYKGFAKVDLQNQLIAAACNIKRWFRKLLGTAFERSKRRSRAQRCLALERFGRFFCSDRSVELSAKKACLQLPGQRQELYRVPMFLT